MIELTTLGGSSVQLDGQELTGLSTHRQKIALLSYLAVEGTVSRDRLLGMLWPDRKEEKARHALSQALYSLKKELGQNLVSHFGDQIALVPDAVVVDVKAMEEAAEAERWDKVVDLYHGPFLDRFNLSGAPGFEEWQTLTRAWVGALARRSFNEVIQSRYAAQDIKGALDAAIRWAKLEPEEDEAQHALIALLAISGDRAAALSRYESCRACLERELQVEPLEATVALVEQVRRGLLPDSPLLNDFVFASQEQGGSRPARPADADVPVEMAQTNVDLDELVEAELGPRLEILRKLGEGTTAAIYLAREPELKRLLAVKVFSPALAPDARARLRFQREVQAIASLAHPNIVTVHWAGTLSNGLPYFVMEYVEGQTMEEKLEAEGVMMVTDGRRVLADIASALAAAHRRGLIHRDVQPANVFFEDETGRALLADFGIVSMLAGAETQPVKLTESGELVGDPRWMSPEQLRDEPATQRCDVYSLGLLGYALLAGRSPYDAETRTDEYAAHVREQPRKLSELRPDVDRDMAVLLEHCLAKEPSRRPTAAYVAEVLDAPGGANGVPEPMGWFGRLLERRVPQWVGAHLAGGFAAVELVELLETRGVLGVGSLDFALISYFAGVPLVFVLAWYHGRAGRQRFERLEYWLLGSVVVMWLAMVAVWLLI